MDLNQTLVRRGPWHFEHVTCADGFTLSVQASGLHYSMPRGDGPYTHFECGFPSHPPLTDAFNSYCEGSIYPFVPHDIVVAEIEAHGGLA